MKRRRPEGHVSEERALISSLDKLQGRDGGCKAERVVRIACAVCGLLLVSTSTLATHHTPHTTHHTPRTTHHPPTYNPPPTRHHSPPATTHHPPPQVILMPAAALLSRVSTLAHVWHLKRGLQLLHSGGGGSGSAEVPEATDRCRVVPSTDAEDDHTDRRARRRLAGLGHQRRLPNSANATISEGDMDVVGGGGGGGRVLDESASEHDSLGRLRCLPNIMFIGASKSGTVEHHTTPHHTTQCNATHAA